MIKEILKRIYLFILIGHTGKHQFEYVKKYIIEDFKDKDKVALYIQAHLKYYPLHVFRINKLIKELENQNL